MINKTTDLQIMAQRAILDDPRTREHGIEVLNKNGIITMKGNVPSSEVKETAESILRDISEVEAVINELHVELSQEDQGNR
ncbi:MAG: hypothetical protein C3F07_15935 [Anaerolineales bacterium]|nr:BON domain-containing protein [Anaerolineae bacterium]PWB70764.1 MAG: hypothetical protein C3F07_15935 [Anaerolineales bacterium]